LFDQALRISLIYKWQIYLLGGGNSKSNNGQPYVQVLNPYNNTQFLSPFQLVNNRYDFSTVEFDVNITAVGGDGGGTLEQVGVCPMSVTGPHCANSNKSVSQICNFGFVKSPTTGDCLAWSVMRARSCACQCTFQY
jgi:hypothetical protein